MAHKLLPRTEAHSLAAIAGKKASRSSAILCSSATKGARALRSAGSAIAANAQPVVVNGVAKGVAALRSAGRAVAIKFMMTAENPAAATVPASTPLIARLALVAAGHAMRRLLVKHLLPAFAALHGSSAVDDGSAFGSASSRESSPRLRSAAPPEPSSLLSRLLLLLGVFMGVLGLLAIDWAAIMLALEARPETAWLQGSIGNLLCLTKEEHVAAEAAEPELETFASEPAEAAIGPAEAPGTVPVGVLIAAPEASPVNVLPAGAGCSSSSYTKMPLRRPSVEEDEGIDVMSTISEATEITEVTSVGGWEGSDGLQSGTRTPMVEMALLVEEEMQRSARVVQRHVRGHLARGQAEEMMIEKLRVEKQRGGEPAPSSPPTPVQAAAAAAAAVSAAAAAAQWAKDKAALEAMAARLAEERAALEVRAAAAEARAAAAEAKADLAVLSEGRQALRAARLAHGGADAAAIKLQAAVRGKGARLRVRAELQATLHTALAAPRPLYVLIPLPVDGGATFQWVVNGGVTMSFRAPDGKHAGDVHEFAFVLGAAEDGESLRGFPVVERRAEADERAEMTERAEITDERAESSSSSSCGTAEEHAAQRSSPSPSLELQEEITPPPLHSPSMASRHGPQRQEVLDVQYSQYEALLKAERLDSQPSAASSSSRLGRFVSILAKSASSGAALSSPLASPSAGASSPSASPTRRQLSFARGRSSTPTSSPPATASPKTAAHPSPPPTRTAAVTAPMTVASGGTPLKKANSFQRVSRLVNRVRTLGRDESVSHVRRTSKAPPSQADGAAPSAGAVPSVGAAADATDGAALEQVFVVESTSPRSRSRQMRV